MFYSHEILTSRKYGVATIWSVDSSPAFPRLTSSRLVATLGQASTLKKVGKKAIQDVNVPKACGMVISPQAPMALRLQSHLLYPSCLPLPAPVTNLLKLRDFACVR
jgi:meiotic recombination protein REC8